MALRTPPRLQLLRLLALALMAQRLPLLQRLQRQQRLEGVLRQLLLFAMQRLLLSLRAPLRLPLLHRPPPHHRCLLA